MGPKRLTSWTSKLWATSLFLSSSSEMSVGIPLITTSSWWSAAREKVWNLILLPWRVFWIWQNCTSFDVLRMILPTDEDLAVRPTREVSGFWKISGAAWRYKDVAIIIGSGKKILGVLWSEEVSLIVDLLGLDVGNGSSLSLDLYMKCRIHLTVTHVMCQAQATVALCVVEMSWLRLMAVERRTHWPLSWRWSPLEECGSSLRRLCCRPFLSSRKNRWFNAD